MHTTRSRPKLVVSADGHGVVSHASSRLLADLAEATTLTSAFSHALHRLRPRGTGHDPGRVAADLAVMLADGGKAIRDLAVLRDQADVFGPVASTPTAWRVPAELDTTALNSLRAARARAREVAWLQADETGHAISASQAAGRQLPGLVLDIDATLVTCHSASSCGCGPVAAPEKAVVSIRWKLWTDARPDSSHTSASISGASPGAARPGPLRPGSTAPVPSPR